MSSDLSKESRTVILLVGVKARRYIRFVPLGLCIASLQVSAADITSPASLIHRGEYVLHAAGCVSCHTDSTRHGKPLAGGRALVTSFGTFYTPNITPDSLSGIGKWSEPDFVRALRYGLRPNGKHYYPVFPYTSYTKLSDDDIHALWQYLRSIEPVPKAKQPHDLAWSTPPRSIVWFWNALYFSAGAYQANPQKSERWNRGAYLAQAAAHCGECHTPRTFLGGSQSSRQYAGVSGKGEKHVAPNITSDGKDGIGKWSAAELAEFLESGLLPDGDTAGGLMAEVIDDGLRYLSKADLAAIAEFVKSQPPLTR